MFERFTGEARHLVVGAQEEARELGHGWIGTEHLLLAALRQPEQPGAATLVRLGVTAERCRTAVTEVVAQQGGGVAEGDAEALKALGIDLDEIRRRAEDAFGSGALDDPGPQEDPARKPRRGLGFGRRRDAEDRQDKGSGKGPGSGHIPFAARAKKALELSLREAIARKERTIGVQHVVLGLLHSEDNISSALFARLALAPKDAREQILADLREAA